MPRNDKTVDDLQSEMTEENWSDWASSFYMGESRLKLPRFEIEWEGVNSEDKGMNETLEAMGIIDAFSPAYADLSGIADISPDLRLYISRVLHKTYIEVNEEGTESAAASLIEIGIIIDGDSDGLPSFNINVNRPFIFVIHDRCNGAVLFIGKVTNPTRA